MEITKEQIQELELRLLEDTPLKISFDVLKDVKLNWWKKLLRKVGVIQDKRRFEVKPLRFMQQRKIDSAISKVFPENTDSIVNTYANLINDHLDVAVYCIGVMLTDPRKEPSKELLHEIKAWNDDESLLNIMVAVTVWSDASVIVEYYRLNERHQSDDDQPDYEKGMYEVVGNLLRSDFHFTEDEILYQKSWASLMLYSASIPDYKNDGKRVATASDEDKFLRKHIK